MSSADRDDRGAVRKPTDIAVVKILQVLEKRYPVAAKHRRSLRQLGSEYIFASPLRSPFDEREWISLIRFSRTLETTYGFTREILALYCPHEDLQARKVVEIRKMLREVERLRDRADPAQVFVHAPDPLLIEKLDDWSTADLTLLPLPAFTVSDEEAARRAAESDTPADLHARPVSRDHACVGP